MQRFSKSGIYSARDTVTYATNPTVVSLSDNWRAREYSLKFTFPVIHDAAGTNDEDTRIW